MSSPEQPHTCSVCDSPLTGGTKGEKPWDVTTLPQSRGDTFTCSGLLKCLELQGQYG